MTEQLRIFLLCILIGIVGGVFYDAFFLLRAPLRVRWVRILCDFLFCLTFGAVYLLFAVSFRMPPLRTYYILGLTLGLFLYLKSFHKIVAFFSEKLYNGFHHRCRGKFTHGRRGKRANRG